jgi:hypothetical protein
MEFRRTGAEMEKLRIDMQLTGLGDLRDRYGALPTRDLIVDHGIELVDDDGEEILKPARWPGDTPPYKNRLTGEREQAWQSQVRPVHQTREMLDEFQRLADAPSKEFLKFANRWGLLGLCKEHGLPFTHPGNEDCMLNLRENLGHWRRLATQTRAILRVATDLRWSDQHPDTDANLGNPEDWSRIDDEADPAWLVPMDLEDAKSSLAGYVSRFVEWAQVVPSLEWSQGVPKVFLNPGFTTFGYIAVQLLFFTAGGRDIAACSECGQLYPSSRQPRYDRRNYCPECRDAGVPDRNAKRRKKSDKRGSA